MNRPAPVEVSYKNMRFLITHNPTNATLSSFIEVSIQHVWWQGWGPPFERRAWDDRPPLGEAHESACGAGGAVRAAGGQRGGQRAPCRVSRDVWR